MVSLLSLLLLLGCALGVCAAMVAAHRRAQSAADLAVLAAAQALTEGRDPCEVAGQVAEGSGARVSSCLVAGHDVLLSVTVSGPRWLGQHHDLAAEARAGPGQG